MRTGADASHVDEQVRARAVEDRLRLENLLESIGRANDGKSERGAHNVGDVIQRNLALGHKAAGGISVGDQDSRIQVLR